MRIRAVDLKTGQPVEAAVLNSDMNGNESVVGYFDQNGEIQFYESQDEILDVPNPEGGVFAKAGFLPSSKPLVRHGD